ncbi:MAG: hypothetical protein JST54_12110 [Deltaproteobacteria bacterium]|nr:hypothetical protein [Deltaproteobacteria bacterium]
MPLLTLISQVVAWGMSVTNAWIDKGTLSASGKNRLKIATVVVVSLSTIYAINSSYRNAVRLARLELIAPSEDEFGRVEIAGKGGLVTESMLTEKALAISNVDDAVFAALHEPWRAEEALKTAQFVDANYPGNLIVAVDKAEIHTIMGHLDLAAMIADSALRHPEIGPEARRRAERVLAYASHPFIRTVSDGGVVSDDERLNYAAWPIRKWPNAESCALAPTRGSRAH